MKLSTVGSATFPIGSNADAEQ